MSIYILVKAFHIIAVIFWMAALMYLPRLYVYHHQAKLGGELETALLGQERRLVKIIMTPAMLAAFVFGLVLVGYNIETLKSSFWLWLKFAFLIALFGFHGMMSADRKKFAAGERPRTEKTYRVLNEVPAFIIIVIVLLVVVKPF